MVDRDKVSDLAATLMIAAAMERADFVTFLEAVTLLHDLMQRTADLGLDEAFMAAAAGTQQWRV